MRGDQVRAREGFQGEVNEGGSAERSRVEPPGKGQKVAKILG